MTMKPKITERPKPTTDIEPDEDGTTCTDGLTAIRRALMKIDTDGAGADNGELIPAAVALLLITVGYIDEARSYWPWKTTPCLTNPIEVCHETLARAGALIAAEIDRQLRGGNVRTNRCGPTSGCPSDPAEYKEVVIPDTVKGVLLAKLNELVEDTARRKKQINELYQFLRTTGAIEQADNIIEKLSHPKQLCH